MLKFHHNKGILECKYGHLLSQPKNSIIITENAIYFFKKAMKKGVSELRKLSNRIGSLCLALLLSIVTFEMSTVSLAPPRYSLGDVNADGVSDAYDALLVLFHCVDLKRMKGVQIQSADVNGDQMVDTSDALMILQHTVGLVDEYPTGPVLVILGDEDDPLLKRARRDFTKNYTTVKIRIVSTEENGMFVSEEDLAAYMKTSNKAKVPDVCFASLNTVGAGGSKGYLLDLNDFAQHPLSERFFHSAIAAQQSAPRSTSIYGFPYACWVRLQFGNQKLLKSLNATLPGNYDELIQLCQKQTEIPSYCIQSNKSASDVVSRFLPWLWRCGGDVLNDAWTAADFANDRGVEALSKYIGMQNRYHASFSKGGSVGTGEFLLSDESTRERGIAEKNNVPCAVSLLPELKAGVARYSQISGLSVVLPDKFADPKAPTRLEWIRAHAAYSFAEFFAQCANQYSASYEEYALSPLISQANMLRRKDEFWKTAYSQLEYAKALPHLQANWVESYLGDGVQLALNNSRTPEEALKAAERQVNRVLPG